jgi:pimeloyl-ACP methyl ester carboxylesterase
MPISLRATVLALVAAAALALIATPAGAATSFVRIKGIDAPGPAKYDRVGVLKQGNPKADHVLVLEPGTSASAAYFRLVAGDIVRELPDWQVWSVERRENLLEDHSRLDLAKRGKITPKQLFDYYLGWLGNSSLQPHFTPVPDSTVEYAKQWGMAVAVGDLHKVVKLAARGGRTVVLGGHSLGGSITTAYATWDFNGKPGAADLSGLVFVDGAAGGRTVPTAAEAQASLDELNQPDQSPFLDLTGNGLPWSAGVFNIVGSTAALRAPNDLSVFDGWPFLPASLRPPVRATNLGGYGYAFDTATSPASLRLIQVHIGHFATSGDPRGWVNGELGTVQRVAAMFAGKGLKGLDGTAWYHPRRLSIDGGAIDNGNDNPAQAVFGDRATHGSDVKLPMYAFETALGDGRVIPAVQDLAKQSHVPKSEQRYVDKSATYAHVDPLAASTSKNAFLKTLLPFLKHKVG